MVIESARLTRCFYIFLAAHIFIWTLAPALVRFTLPLDAMEGTTWGHQLQWGYDKNPFMNGWLTELAIKLTGPSGWGVYLFSQLSVGICFFAMWRLGKKFLTPLHAFLAVILLEGIQYYHLHAIDFNDNTLELGFWALTILFFYRALQKNTLCDWVLTSVFASCGMMTKYFTALLLFSMLAFVIWNAEARKHFKNPYFYAAILIFSAMILPHLLWLFSHDFITVKYAILRVSGENAWSDHIFYPAKFAWQQFEAFLPAVILVIFLLLNKSKTTFNSRETMKSFDKSFLIFVGIGPFLLTIALSILTGIKLRAGWGQPLLSLWGILLIYLLQPTLDVKAFNRFFIFLFVLMFSTVLGYSAALLNASEPSSANYPGKKIAAKITKEWHQKYHESLYYVAGSRWLAGNISFYSNDNPSVYIDSSKRVSPWIDENKLKKNGAVFVWDLAEDNEVPWKEIKARFPQIEDPKPLQFNWLRNRKMEPVKIMTAFLPPSSDKFSEAQNQSHPKS